MLVLWFFISPAVYALDTVSLTLGSINASAWHAQGVAIALTDINKQPQQLALTINKLGLPPPFFDFSLINIRCTAFTWQHNELRCQHGQASLDSTQWQSRTADFSFQIEKNYAEFHLTDLHYLGGIASMDGDARGDNWSLHLTLHSAEAKALLALLPSPLFTPRTGNVNLQLDVAGNQNRIDTLRLTTDITQLTGQIATGKFATDNLNLTAQVSAQHTLDNWQWQSQGQLNTGAVYAEPLYIKADGQPLRLLAHGALNTDQQDIIIQSVNLQQLPTGTLDGSATVNYKNSLSLKQAAFSLHSNDLQNLVTVYAKPFFTPSVIDRLRFTGQLTADFALTDAALTALTATVTQLAITDSAQRIKLQHGNGTFHWSVNEGFNQPSQFAWQQLQLYALPFGAAQVKFLTRARSIQLLGDTHLPLLDGDFHIQQFNWQAKDNDSPTVSFQGDLTNISLQKLSTALQWQPLFGTLSGHIPQVTYSNKQLKLEGELLIKVFGGTVKMANLAAAHLFDGLPTFYSDIDIDQLDLEQLTGKYQFGSITGKLSGFVKQLHIENGRPISFFAWLGTPDNDDTPHRISQKAVNNIAQIGGSGTSDLLSKSFLTLFDTFGYDKIGLGCYLHEGVCQLSGVSATESGYTIVQGGGLPRINVIGYNTRVDWTVLVERLTRLSTSDKVIIQ